MCAGDGEVCDTGNTEVCICDASSNYVNNGNNICVCDADNNYIADGGSCKISRFKKEKEKNFK